VAPEEWNGPRSCNSLSVCRPQGWEARDFVGAEKSDQNERRSVVARGLFANWHFIAQTAFMVLAAIASGVGGLDTAPAQSQGRAVTTSDILGSNARQAMIDIFRKKDGTAVDRYFGKPFIQHDPNLADGLAGMKSFAAEVANSRGTA
jgi:hypothetical protein